MLNLPRFYSIGAIAQLVEHRTENPGVPGSIPGGTTAKPRKPPLDLVSSGAFQFMLTEVLMDFNNNRDASQYVSPWFWLVLHLNFQSNLQLLYMDKQDIQNQT